MNKIVVVGSLNVDYVFELDHMPAVGETILAKNFQMVPGGKGANQAFTLGRMGADVSMLGAVGQDENARFELNSLESVGVDTSHIARLEAATGMAMIPVNGNGDNSIIVVQGANALVTPGYIDSNLAVLQKAEIVLLQLEIPLETVLHTAKLAKSLGKTVILDPAPAPDTLPGELYRCVDYLKPNEIELAMLTGLTDHFDLQAACDRLLQQGVGCVLASLGPKGVYVGLPEGRSRLLAVQAVPVVDTTAAGDSFTAAIAYALANGRDIVDAATFANQIASVVVQRKGAQSSIPTGREVADIWNRAFSFSVDKAFAAELFAQGSDCLFFYPGYITARNI